MRVPQGTAMPPSPNCPGGQWVLFPPHRTLHTPLHPMPPLCGGASATGRGFSAVVGSAPQGEEERNRGGGQGDLKEKQRHREIIKIEIIKKIKRNI